MNRWWRIVWPVRSNKGGPSHHIAPAPANPRISGRRDRTAGQREAVHLERSIRLLVNIKMALIPGRRQIVRANSRLMEEMPSAAIEERQNDVWIISGVDLVAGMNFGGVVAKSAEVAIERAVLLQHYDDVLDSLQTAVGYNIYVAAAVDVWPWLSVAVMV